MGQQANRRQQMEVFALQLHLISFKCLSILCGVFLSECSQELSENNFRAKGFSVAPIEISIEEIRES